MLLGLLQFWRVYLHVLSGNDVDTADVGETLRLVFLTNELIPVVYWIMLFLCMYLILNLFCLYFSVILLYFVLSFRVYIHVHY